MPRKQTRRVCFVTGTRAEFGLMESTLRAIRSHRQLQLQIVATGMHLDPRRGSTLREIENDGWTVDRIVRWSVKSNDASATARATGSAMGGLVRAFDDLQSDMVLVVGDRVEAFAAAAAAHVSGRIVAHVHGGDRAMGQVDDSLRHAITKLAHIHFPATQESAKRIIRLGEDRERVHCVGSPGIDGIVEAVDEAGTRVMLRDANACAQQFALLVLHPVDPDDRVEARRAVLVSRAVTKHFEKILVVHPNNDPGSEGIVRTWNALSNDERFVFHRNVTRGVFLGLMRDSALLIGNSSSGIIEAASFGTAVVDIGPRQLGRERGDNVVHCEYSATAITAAIHRAMQKTQRKSASHHNIYGGRGTAKRIAAILARCTIDSRLRRKLIAY